MVISEEHHVTTVMILGNQPPVAQGLQHSLRALGYAVLPPLDSVESAIRMNREGRPDVIILDMQFCEGQCGQEFHKQLTAHRKVPIVYLSSESVTDSQETVFGDGPVAVLTKPIGLRQLDTVLRNIIRNPERLSDPAAPSASGREEHLYSRLIHSLPQCITYTDTDLVYRFVNDTYLQESGLKKTQVLGRQVQDLLDRDSFKRLKPGIRSALSGRTVRYQETLRYTDGTERHIDGYMIPDFGPDGSVIGLFSMYHDVTPYKKTEAELLQRLKIESLVSSVALDCLFCSDDEPDDAVTESLERVGLFTEAEYAFRGVYDVHNGFRISHLWHTPGLPDATPVTWVMQEFQHPWFTERVHRGDPVLFSDPRELPPETEPERVRLASLGVRSCAVVPSLNPDGSVVLIGVVTTNSTRRWGETETLILSTVGGVTNRVLTDRLTTPRQP
jgi:PAS domain S-box-containing protein